MGEQNDSHNKIGSTFAGDNRCSGYSTVYIIYCTSSITLSLSLSLQPNVLTAASKLYTASCLLCSERLLPSAAVTLLSAILLYNFWGQQSFSHTRISQTHQDVERRKEIDRRRKGTRTALALSAREREIDSRPKRWGQKRWGRRCFIGTSDLSFVLTSPPCMSNRTWKRNTFLPTTLS